MTERELADRRAKAVYMGARGKRFRAWWLRLWITPIGDAMRGKLWPNSPDKQRYPQQETP